MSHKVDCKNKISDINTLRAVCQTRGFDLVQKSSYTLWGRNEKCDFAIQIPGKKWEIGVVKNGNSYDLAYDHYIEREVEGIQVGYQRQIVLDEQIESNFDVASEYETADEYIMEIEV